MILMKSVKISILILLSSFLAGCKLTTENEISEVVGEEFSSYSEATFDPLRGQGSLSFEDENILFYLVDLEEGTVTTFESGEEVIHSLVAFHQEGEEYILESDTEELRFTILSESVVEDNETGVQYQYEFIE